MVTFILMDPACGDIYLDSSFPCLQWLGFFHLLVFLCQCRNNLLSLATIPSCSNSLSLSVYDTPMPWVPRRNSKLWHWLWSSEIFVAFPFPSQAPLVSSSIETMGNFGILKIWSLIFCIICFWPDTFYLWRCLLYFALKLLNIDLFCYG